MKNALREKEDFQKLVIEKLLEENGYVERGKENFARSYAMDTELLLQFIQTTQTDEYEKLVKTYKENAHETIINRINAEINKTSRGLIDVLKHGVEIDNTTSLTLLFNKPATDFNKDLMQKYNSNIFSVMEEVYHKDGERLDLVLFVNGLAIATFELKCNTSGQSVEDAILQYKADRDPNTRLLKHKVGALVHFAMDLEEVFMCTKLDGKSSFFLPFNKGNGIEGKGNPEAPKGKLKVHYMWEDILTKDTLVYLIKRFVFIEKKVLKKINLLAKKL